MKIRKWRRALLLTLGIIVGGSALPVFASPQVEQKQVKVYNETWRPSYAMFEPSSEGSVSILQADTGKEVYRIDFSNRDNNDVRAKGEADIKLPLGKYVFKYSETGNGLRQIEQKVLTVSNEEKEVIGGVKDEGLQVRMQQEPSTADLKINFSIDGKPVGVDKAYIPQKAHFTLYKDNQLLTNELHVDNNGELTYLDLKPGKYSLEMSGLPENMQVQQSSDGQYNNFQFEVKDNSKGIKHTYNLKTLEGLLTVSILDSKGKPVSDVKLSIKDEKGKVVELTTNKEGKGIKALNFGKYKISQDRPVDGHYAIDGEQEVEITQTNPEPVLKLINNVKTFTLNIETLDSKTKGNVSGAEYRLTRNGIDYRYVPGFKTVIPFGDYEVFMSQAPEGYKAVSSGIKVGSEDKGDSQTIQFFVEKDGEHKAPSKEDEKAKESFLSVGQAFTLGATFVLIAVCAYVFFRRIR
ncbi:hypothetical protein UT300012_23970 [Paraclostridium bifermentans]